MLEKISGNTFPIIMLPLNQSARKKEALEETIYYTLSNLLLTIKLDSIYTYKIFNLSKQITEILLVDSKSKWDEFFAALDDYGYPEELQSTAQGMILEWYTLLSR